MLDPKPCAGEVERGEEVVGVLEVACGDASEVLEAVEEAFDPVALTIEVSVDGPNHTDIALARDVSRCARGLDGGDHRLPVVAAVSDDVAGQSERTDELRCSGLVGGLSRREQEPDRQASPVHDGMDLGRQAPTGETDGVIRAPFFPPAACWWARTMELSIRCSEAGDFSARASKTRNQTPAFAHLL